MAGTDDGEDIDDELEPSKYIEDVDVGTFEEYKEEK